jgi:tape measure domain-containing protein
MASIQAGIQLVDRFSAPLMNIINSVNMAVSQMETLNNTMNTDVDASAYENIRSELHQATTAAQGLREELSQTAVPAAMTEQTSRVGDAIEQNTRSQQNFNQSMQGGVSGAKSLVGALAGLSIVKSAIGAVKGQMDAAINRMDTMSNYSRTMTAITGSSDVATASLAKLKDMTKGTAYGLDTAASSVQNFVTRGMGTGDAVNQVKAWSDAVAFYGDGTNDSLREVTDALGKMMTKGKVEMDQLDRLTDRGIDAVGIYAKATGQSSSVVQSNLSKGTISAQDFINTVSGAFENGTNGVLNISGAAKKAGDTWETSIANAKAAVTRGLISVIDGVNEGLSNAGFGTILDGIKSLGSTAETVLNNVGNIASGTITLLAPVAGWIANCASSVINNWSAISPIVYGVAAAIAAYCAAMAIVKAVELVSTGIKMAMCVAAYAHAAATGTEVTATAAATATQLGLNTALLSCPLTWIILLTVALIGVIVLVASKIAKTGGVAKSTFGVICGSLKVVVSVVENLIIGVVNTIISLLIELWNLIAKLANFLGNVFRNPVGAVAKLFCDLLDTIMSVAQSVAQTIDTLIGTDLSDGISGVRNQFSNYVDGIVGKQEVYVKTVDPSKYMIKRKNYGEAYKSGSSFGDGVTNKVKNMFSGKKAATDMNKNDYEKTLRKTQGTNLNQATAANTAATAKNTAGTAKNTAKSAQALTATSEDLKYIRDMAAQKYINRFTTAKITVHQTNHNKISKELDLDGVTEHLRKTMEEQMISAAEGVHI